MLSTFWKVIDIYQWHYHLIGTTVLDELNNHDYEFLFNQIKIHTGITFDLNKNYLIDGQISKFTKQMGFVNPKELIAYFQSNSSGTAIIDFAHSLLTHETQFFRDKKHFTNFFRDVVTKQIKMVPIYIWSAACSSGQEPYSIAMSLLENAGNSRFLGAKIYATDLNLKVVEYARKGIYSKPEILRGMSTILLNKYFNPLDDDYWQVKLEVRDRVTFNTLNLMDYHWQLPKFHVVYIRNVLIYFKKTERLKIIQHVKKHLLNGGIVVTGTSEDISQLDPQFSKQIYQDSLYYVFNDA